jgi:hypothetical protein
VTISVGALLLIALFLEWKLKGPQWPGLLLGAGIMKEATANSPGGIVDQLGATELEVIQSIATAIGDALSGIV